MFNRFPQITLFLALAGGAFHFSVAQTPTPAPRTGNGGAVHSDFFKDGPQAKPWEYGVFANGGTGTSDTSGFRFFALGVHGGKFLTGPMGKGWLRGQFEYGVELMPLWQAYTPKAEANYCQTPPGDGEQTCSGTYLAGGTYTGLSITPIILRWNLEHRGRWRPWIQGAGGVVWTNHKFPALYQEIYPGHLGTSVFNFTPQFGVGFHYFVRPRQSINFGANAVHISNSSLGDANPGVNASVQFSLGYTWWK